MHTHTYVTLKISQAAYNEIRSKLIEAGYHHALHEDGIIDMHGLAVIPGSSNPDPIIPQRVFLDEALFLGIKKESQVSIQVNGKQFTVEATDLITHAEVVAKAFETFIPDKVYTVMFTNGPYETSGDMLPHRGQAVCNGMSFNVQ